MITRILRRTLGALVVIAALGQAAAAEPFSAEKRQEIERIMRDYLLSNPEILRDAFRELERRQQAAQAEAVRGALAKNADAMFRSEHTYVAGNPEGDVTVVEFFDYNCPYCKRSFEEISRLIEQDPQLRVVMREFPILGPGSIAAARAALASRKQDKYWEFHEALMRAENIRSEAQVMAVAEQVGLDTAQLKKDMEDPSVVAAINEGYELAQALGIQGTPTFVVDDRIVPNSEGVDQVIAGIAAEIRSNGGCKIC